MKKFRQKSEKKKETNEADEREKDRKKISVIALLLSVSDTVVKKSFLFEALQVRNKKKPRKLFFRFLFTRETSTQLRNFGSVGEKWTKARCECEGNIKKKNTLVALWKLNC